MCSHSLAAVVYCICVYCVCCVCVWLVTVNTVYIYTPVCMMSDSPSLYNSTCINILMSTGRHGNHEGY